MMHRMLLLLLLNCLLESCTINIIQTDTHGQASDVVDSDPSTDAKPDISVPVSLTP